MIEKDKKKLIEEKLNKISPVAAGDYPVWILLAQYGKIKKLILRCLFIELVLEFGRLMML